VRRITTPSNWDSIYVGPRSVSKILYTETRETRGFVLDEGICIQVPASRKGLQAAITRPLRGCVGKLSAHISWRLAAGLVRLTKQKQKGE
jgi:hypothetical protein